jgi:CheY-like chemotaxis protein
LVIAFPRWKKHGTRSNPSTPEHTGQRVQRTKKTVRSANLILLDWVLRDGTGIELCTALRSMKVRSPILFYTGLELTREQVNEAMTAGAQGFHDVLVEAREARLVLLDDLRFKRPIPIPWHLQWHRPKASFDRLP